MDTNKYLTLPCLTQSKPRYLYHLCALLVRPDWPILYSVRPSSLTPHFRPITTTTTLDGLCLTACIALHLASASHRPTARSYLDLDLDLNLNLDPSFLPFAFLSSFFYYTFAYTSTSTLPRSQAPPTADPSQIPRPPFSLMELNCLPRTI